MDENRTETPKKLISNFADDTSAHGFHSVKHARSTLGKICWSVCILSMWSVCGYQTSKTISRFFSFSTKTQVQIKTSKDAVYPALSLCNLNPIKKSKYRENPEVFKDVLKGIETVANYSSETWEDIENLTRKYPEATTLFTQIKKQLYYSFYQNRVNLSSMGHKINDMLIGCTLQGTYCTPLNFHEWHVPQFGNCYTIFLHNKSVYVGPDYGLSLSLFVQDDEYMPLVSPAAGFRVQIHSPVYIPFPEMEGFTISPGSATSVAFSESKIKRQDYPYDFTNCGDQDEMRNSVNVFTFWEQFVSMNLIPSVNYTTSVCTKSCFLLQVEKECGCIDATTVTWFDTAKHYNFGSIPPACDRSDYAVNNCIRKMAWNADIACEATCPQSCEETTYKMRVTSSYWPRPTFFETMKKSYASRVPAIANMTVEQAMYNLASVEIYFENLNYESVMETPSMDLTQLLSNIGGTLGLYVGASFLTVSEFFALFVRLFKSCMKARKIEAKSVDLNHLK